MRFSTHFTLQKLILLTFYVLCSGILHHVEVEGSTVAKVRRALENMSSVPVLTNSSPFHSSSSHPASFYGDLFFSKGKTSENGLVWQPMNINYRHWLNGIDHVGGKYIVTGPAGQIFTSENGIDYTLRYTPDRDDLTGISYGNGTFVVRKYWQAGSMITSTDSGVTWTTRTTGNGGSPDKTYNSVTFGNGVFVFSAKEGVRVSSNGLTWIFHLVSHPYSSSGMKWTSFYEKIGKFITLNMGTTTLVSGQTVAEVRLGESTNGVDWSFRSFPLPYAGTYTFGGMIDDHFFFYGVDGANKRLLLLTELSSSAVVTDLGSYLPEGTIQKIAYGNECLVVSTETHLFSGEAVMEDPIIDLQNGLVSWWQFEDAQGTTLSDSSGNNNTATLMNGPVWVDGRSGGGLSFDGSNDWVDAGEKSVYELESGFTLSAWINPTRYSNWTGVVGRGIGRDGGSWNGAIHLMFGDNENSYRSNIEICSGSTKKHLDGASLVPLNGWSHLVASWNGLAGENALKVYFNGSMESQGDSHIDTLRNNFSGNSGKMRLGVRDIRGSNSAYGYFKGTMDEVRIYNRALSEAEVLALYELELAQPVSPSNILLSTNEIAENQPTGTLVGNLTLVGPEIRDGQVDEDYRLVVLNTSTNEISEVVEGTGALTPIMTVPFNVGQAHGFDRNPADGKLYLARIPENNTLQFYDIDLDAQSATLTKSFTTNFSRYNFSSMGFTNEGDVYLYQEVSAFSVGSLYFIDWDAGTVTRKGSTNTPSILGGDYDSERNVFWATDEWRGKLYQVDSSNSAITWISTSTWNYGSGPNIGDVDVTPDGQVLVAVHDNGGSKILKVDVDAKTWSTLYSLSPDTELRLASVAKKAVGRFELLSGQVDNASFEISGDQLLTNQTFDYETKNSYSIWVRGYDEHNLSIDRDFTISVLDVYEEPNTPPHGLRAVPALSVVENQPAGYVVGQILATDPDGDAITYTLVSGNGDTNNNDFLLEANGTLKTTRSLQYPKGSNLSIRVQATDSNNASIEKVFRVTRPPGRPRLSGNFVIPDTFGVGDVVCEITAEDADGDIISFFLVDGEGAENNAKFVLDPTGRLRTATAMDYDATGNWSVRIQIKDENNATFEINLASVRERIYDHSVEGNISDSSETHAQDDYSDSNQSQAPEPNNSPPRDLNTSTVLQIAENAPIGTWIADFTSIDPDGGTIEYRLLPGYDGSDSFRLETNGTLLSTKEFDYESDPTSYLIGVEAKDENEAVVRAEFTVSILDVWENRPPRDLNTSTVLQIAENASIGTWIGDFTAIDPDGESLVYRLLPGYEGFDSFRLEANGTLLSTKEFDFESNPTSYLIGVEAKDENEAVVRAEFTVSILDVWEDSNHSATTTEDLLDANTSMYEDSNEESASYSSETHAQDHYSDFNQSQAPESDNSPPRDLNSSTVLQIAENVPIGSWIGDFTAIDPDGESLVYRMLPGYEGYNSFRLDTNGTLLSTKEFDYESDPASYLIGVEAKDENEAVVTAEFTVSILDVLEDSNKSTTIQTKLFIDVNTAFYEESVGSESNGSATISVTDELSKWEETLVLGPFYKSDSGWVFSMNFGWVYFDERDFDDSWFWVEQLGWVWTLESTFPFLFLNQYNHWFYFFEEDEDKWLYNYLLEEWMSL